MAAIATAQAKVGPYFERFVAQPRVMAEPPPKEVCMDQTVKVVIR
jgi:hypothetical protein